MSYHRITATILVPVEVELGVKFTKGEAPTFMDPGSDPEIELDKVFKFKAPRIIDIDDPAAEWLETKEGRADALTQIDADYEDARERAAEDRRELALERDR